MLFGLMISIGASGLIGQVASGMILMYTRAFRVGEYVRIGDTEGTVVELGTFTTRLRTGLGEEVLLPEQLRVCRIRRRTIRARSAGTGFVVAHRRHHRLFDAVAAGARHAARRPRGARTSIAADPPPVVRQTALSDFYVEYRLLAYARRSSSAAQRIDMLSRLHANIQDVFNEHGVQIMSPHYMTDPAAAAGRAQGALVCAACEAAGERCRGRDEALASSSSQEGISMIIERLFRSAATAVLTIMAGCASMTDSKGPEAPAPAYHVGDRWTYDAVDGFRQKTLWVETHEVIAIAPAGITVRITQAGDRIDNVRTELWPAPGLVTVGALYDNETRRFAAPLQRYNFPLKPGGSWNQWVENVNESSQSQGAINRYVAVDGWERVATPAGSFNAIRLRVLMRLDDGEFWRGPTKCSDVVWYAPDARAIVRAERDAQYIELDGPDSATVYTQHAVLELRAFTPGA